MAQNININVTVNPAPNAIYYPINDNATAASFEAAGYAVRTVPINGVPQRVGIVHVETAMQALTLNREFNRTSRQDKRVAQRQATHETSYDVLAENGFEQKARNSDPLAKLIHKESMAELAKVLDTLSERDLFLCSMIGDKMTEREMAAELDIPQSTLHGQKVALLKKLNTLLDKLY